MTGFFLGALFAFTRFFFVAALSVMARGASGEDKAAHGEYQSNLLHRDLLFFLLLRCAHSFEGCRASWFFEVVSHGLKEINNALSHARL